MITLLKYFNGWTLLIVMLYVVIIRFDSLDNGLPAAEARKLYHLDSD